MKVFYFLHLYKFLKYLVSLGDTIGVGSVGKVNKLLDEVLAIIPPEKIAVHFHDTYGQALSNVLVSINVNFYVSLECTFK